MKHIKMFEDLPAMYDPTYANDVFKIRYRSVNDLSNKKGSDSIDKPVNDVLDGIEEGDYVRGKGVEDKKTYSGVVVRVEKDSEGENTEIHIETDGKVIELYPSSVEFVDRGDKGNKTGIKTEPVDTGNIDYTFGGYDNFQPTTYEMKNIKTFSSLFEEKK